jgi:hypothetical protein
MSFVPWLALYWAGKMVEAEANVNTYKDYDKAIKEAKTLSKQTHSDIGIEKILKGRKVLFKLHILPILENRSGCELKWEVVKRGK